MRDYLKSFSSLSWAMSLFGLKHLGALLSFPGFRRRSRRAPGKGPDSAADLDAITRTLTESLGSTLMAFFHSGDRILRGLVDLSLGRPRRRSTAAAMPWLDLSDPRHEGSAPSGSAPVPGAGVPPVSGWGPMPPIPDVSAARGATSTSNG